MVLADSPSRVAMLRTSSQSLRGALMVRSSLVEAISQETSGGAGKKKRRALNRPLNFFKGTPQSAPPLKRGLFELGGVVPFPGLVMPRVLLRGHLGASRVFPTTSLPESPPSKISRP